MRAEKQNISAEYIARLNSSPFFIVVDYQGLKVGPITELRKRLFKAGCRDARGQELHLPHRGQGSRRRRSDAGTLAGQLAVVTGRQDVSVRRQRC